MHFECTPPTPLAVDLTCHRTDVSVAEPTTVVVVVIFVYYRNIRLHENDISSRPGAAAT